MKLAVAIYVEDRVDLAYQTIQSVFAGIATRFELTLLADGVEVPDDFAPGRYLQLDILHFPEAVGAPAALNAWIANCDASIEEFIFLENGLVLGQSCVPQLLEALSSSPTIGLAGPSTNLCWNDQQIPWRGTGSLDQVHVADEHVQMTYGGQLLSLAPLYSLGPFCIAFKRELVNAIGGAHPGYGLGPCWEMDFHARAERAGFQGVLVKGAFAWRTTSSPLHRQREAERFQANKFLYQDRLCALKLLKKTDGYEPHCKGDECEHFAPAALIELKVALPAATLSPTRHRLHDQDLPLISCIMPTANRPHFVAQAITYFLRQDYPAKELIIVYDQESDLPPSLPEHPHIRFHLMESHQSIGNKRNMALDLSCGELIALWDDDDWYHSSRLRRQVMPILLGLADVSGLQYPTLYAIEEGRFWQPGVRLFQRMFRGHVVAGSIIYRKSLVDRGVRYPNLSMTEDAYFLERAMAIGARLFHIPAQDIYLYIRHGNNTWRFREGNFLLPFDWHERQGHGNFEKDQTFYQQMIGKADAAVVSTMPPLVSCIMPTANRASFIPAAIQHFIDQDYPNKELIIIDDGQFPVKDLVPLHPQIHYAYSAEKRSIGAKRNQACQMAQGDIILHWDDDDWIAPTWVSTQVAILQNACADVTGLSVVRFFDPQQRRAWQYQYPLDLPAWVYGATLCYLKSLWERNPFPEINVGEDNAFVWSAIDKVIVPHQEWHLFAARVHPGNTSAKMTHDARWRALSFEVIEEMMG